MVERQAPRRKLPVFQEEVKDLAIIRTVWKQSIKDRVESSFPPLDTGRCEFSNTNFGSVTYYGLSVILNGSRIAGFNLKLNRNSIKISRSYHQKTSPADEDEKWNDGVLGLFCAHCLG